MQVVWCPHPGLLNEFKGREDQVLAGQMGEYKEQEVTDEELGKADGKDGSVRNSGKPGEIGDGWGRLLPSLEGFPYADYGIGVREESQL